MRFILKVFRYFADVILASAFLALYEITQITRVDFPILFIWMSPLKFLGASGVFFILFHFLMKFV